MLFIIMYGECYVHVQEVEEEGDGMVGEGGEETQYHAVELSRGTRGFGFSIRGGREFQNMALYVLQIADNGPAALDGRLQVGLATHSIKCVFSIYK